MVQSFKTASMQAGKATGLPAVCLAAALSIVAPGHAAAQPALTTIHSFTGSDGATPYGGVISDNKGNLYGITTAGGASNDGVAYELSPPAAGQTNWTDTSLWVFSGTDGNHSEATLLRDAKGNLYGTTAFGGGNNDGVVFELTPPARKNQPWVHQTLWSFSSTDAASPFNGVIEDKAGNLYGTTVYGGANSVGAVFELSPPAGGQTAWTENTLWSFVGPEGQTPVGELKPDLYGNFFGPAQYGGAYDQGTVYELSPPGPNQTGWNAVSINDFAGGTKDGAQPYPLLDRRGNEGDFFGTTLNGGPNNAGSIFQMIPPRNGRTEWTRKTIFMFDGSNNGTAPFGKLIRDKNGVLYGTTGYGSPSNYGTVFKLAPPAPGQGKGGWTMTTLWTFSGADGGNPGDSLFADRNGVLYGTTGSGGANNDGTIFALTGSGYVPRR